jgi:signal recognition particle receptor subunit beta
MVLFNYSTKELTAKVVYYGAGLCGKTTNLQWIHEKLPIKNKGKMVSLATEADRTLFFDFLPIELGTIRGMKTRIQLYTVPGQVFYNATRRMVLKGADCVVFVADSQEAMVDANLDALQNLRDNLEANEIDPDEIPTVLQYNKRDLPNALPVEVLNQRLNPRGWPHYEASAKQGIGVEETLKGVTGLVFRSLAAKYGGAEAAAPKAPPKPAAAAAKPPAAPPPKPPLAPPPRPAPPPVRPAVPSAIAGASTDDLLDSLGLPEPAPPPPPAAPTPLDELGLGDAPELSLEPEPAPSPPPPPAIEDLALEDVNTAPRLEPIDAAADITEPIDAAADITAPDITAPEISLEELGGSPEPTPPEISLEALAPEPEPEPPQPPPPPPQPMAAPPAPPALAASAGAVSPPAPVTVQVAKVPSQAEVMVPVEVVLADGNQTVVVNLRLTINLQRK